VNKALKNPSKRKQFYLKFKFESLREQDLDTCADAILSTLKGQLATISEDKETVKSMIYGRNVETIIAKREDKIAGLISGTLPVHPRITFLAVTDPTSAKEGLSGLLIDEFLKTARKRTPKAQFVLHNELAENHKAIGLFSMKGFIVNGFMRDTMTGRDIVFMKKPFSS
jgi:hypothetical protein